MPHAPALLRPLLIAAGWLCVGLGVAGIFLPVLPTTPFLLLALWAFARSSPRFHHWLLTHRWFGPVLQDWERHRVIPIRAKLLAVAGMSGGMIWVTFFSAAPWYAAALMGVTVAYGAWFVLGKPSRRPDGLP
ncbi:MAG: YbaN family protein [Alphaproteobacteria bacterium]|nr:YbaN family protein [Alphaproteobacteria bacterium]